MATITDSQITSSNTTYNLTKASMSMYAELFGNKKFNPLDTIMNTLKQCGVFNYEEKLQNSAGDTVRMYNTPRLDMVPNRGDIDRYSNAQEMKRGDREMQIGLLSGTIVYDKRGTFRQQLAEFNLKENIPQMLQQWMKNLMLYSILNVAAGNTATSISAPRVYSSDISVTSDKLSLTGNNTAVAPSSRYKAIGSKGAGSVTTDEGVTSSNKLTLEDFMVAREVITSPGQGIPIWSTVNRMIKGDWIDAVAFVSTTGLNQMKFDPVTQGQGVNYAQINNAQISAGSKALDGLTGFVLEHILFIEVPDDLLPRGVNSSSSAAVANTRRAVMLGANAIDIAAGQGYTEGSITVPGFNVEIDETYKKLNNQGYADVSWCGGIKKTQLLGTGANAANRYDLATYVITHYSAN